MVLVALLLRVAGSDVNVDRILDPMIVRTILPLVALIILVFTGIAAQTVRAVTNIASLNEVNPNGPFYSSNVAAPQIRQPYTSQSSVGWSHELSSTMVVDVDYTHSVGKDIGVRWPLNTRIPGPGGNGPRRYADLPLNPANPTLTFTVPSSSSNRASASA